MLLFGDHALEVKRKRLFIKGLLYFLTKARNFHKAINWTKAGELFTVKELYICTVMQDLVSDFSH